MRHPNLRNPQIRVPLQDWKKMDKPAPYLVDSQTGVAMNTDEAETVIRLYNKLSDFDKILLHFNIVAMPST